MFSTLIDSPYCARAQVGGPVAPFFDASQYSPGTEDEVLVRALLLETTFTDEAQRTAFYEAALHEQDERHRLLGHQWAGALLPCRRSARRAS